MASILLVDDEPRVTLILEGELLDEGFDVTATNSAVEAIDMLEKQQFDLVITDLSMPEKSGIDVLEAAKRKGNVAMILMTAYGSFDSAVKAGSLGVAKYIAKPFENAKLVELAHQVLSYSALQGRMDKETGEAAAEFKAQAHGIVFGKSPAITRVNQMIKQVAATNSTVLVTGPTGSGKEVAARLMHELSSRAKKPFVAVNCAALTETLLESELFGHVKGSFTGATALKRGRFELADGGTIFLDEIGETSGALQTKLLRVLEERVFTRVGGTDDLKVDVRVIAATNRDLKKETAAGNFREDLYFRLNVFPIETPSLAERAEDIPEFVRHFLNANNKAEDDITADALDLLSAYSWPGNVRELRNIIERAAILAGRGKIEAEHLGIEEGGDVPISPDGEGSGSSGAGGPGGLEGAEKELIQAALKNSGDNKTEAAKLLGITRRRLYSRMKFHGIEL
ncbi:MAG: sigma-54-dependent transcriptional regulator [Candidatus Zixiibacteriota bacterium]